MKVDDECNKGKTHIAWVCISGWQGRYCEVGLRAHAADLSEMGGKDIGDGEYRLLTVTWVELKSILGLIWTTIG